MKIEKIFILVDASKIIGMGHLFRCLTLADYFKKNKIQSIFITQEQESQDIIKKKGFDSFLKPNFINYDFNKLKGFFRSNGTNKIITDINYSDNADFEKVYLQFLINLKNLNVFTVAFEKPVKDIFPSDIVIVPYVVSFSSIKKNENTKYLLGPSYFPLRDQFYNSEPRLNRGHVKNILITMGGSDPKLITLKVCELLATLNFRITLKIVLGKLCRIKPRQIKSIFVDKIIDLKIYKNTQNMAEVMFSSDVGITNSGLSKYEMAKCGLPALIISNHANDKVTTRLFAKTGAAIDLGCIDSLNESFFLKRIKDLINEKIDLKLMSSSGLKLMEGKGTAKIYNHIFGTK